MPTHWPAPAWRCACPAGRRRPSYRLVLDRASRLDPTAWDHHHDGHGAQRSASMIERGAPWLTPVRRSPSSSSPPGATSTCAGSSRGWSQQTRRPDDVVVVDLAAPPTVVGGDVERGAPSDGSSTRRPHSRSAAPGRRSQPGRGVDRRASTSCSWTSTASPLPISCPATPPSSPPTPARSPAVRSRYLREGWVDRCGSRPATAESLEDAQRRARGAAPPARPLASCSATTTSGSGRLSFGVSRPTWDRLGGFDDGFVGYGAEDTDSRSARRRAGHPAGVVRGRGGLPPVAPAHPPRPRPPRRDDRQRPPVPTPLGPVADGGLVDPARRRLPGPLRSRGRAPRTGRQPTMSGPGPRLATSVVVGPEHHGVVRHAIAVAGLTGSPVLRLSDPGERPVAPTTPVVHLHYTDRLFGATSDRAAGACLELIRRLACPAVVTLHDVPNGGCTPHDRRRAAAYRALAASVDGVVVSSDHERHTAAGLRRRRRADGHPPAHRADRAGCGDGGVRRRRTDGGRARPHLSRQGPPGCARGPEHTARRPRPVGGRCGQPWS